jgi:membrane protein DedA with SNARE-associated domain
MSVDHFMTQYGLWAVFFGCMVEGETVAITGGIFAHRHLLVLWQVVVMAGLGAYISDMSYFLAGRKFQDTARLRAILARPSFARAIRAVDRNTVQFAAAFRFIPGMRIVGPLALAQSKISTRRFAVVAALSAMVWSILFTVMGHAVGALIAALFGRLHRGEVLLIVPGVVLLLVLGFVMLRAHRRRQS